MRFSISRRYGFGFAIVLTLAVSGAAVIVGSKLVPAFPKKGVVPRVISPTRADEASAQTAPAQNVSPQAPAIPILLKPRGFVPKEISKSAGPYYFAVGNLSGVPEVSLRLEREHGARIQEMNARKEKPWRQIVHLTPGTYLITEANHPDWVCRITVTPH
jgi:hypothetical protein